MRVVKTLPWELLGTPKTRPEARFLDGNTLIRVGPRPRKPLPPFYKILRLNRDDGNYYSPMVSGQRWKSLPGRSYSSPVDIASDWYFQPGQLNPCRLGIHVVTYGNLREWLSLYAIPRRNMCLMIFEVDVAGWLLHRGDKWVTQAIRLRRRVATEQRRTTFTWHMSSKGPIEVTR
jgi:hypothetical protein